MSGRILLSLTLLLSPRAFAGPQKIHGLYVNTFGDAKDQALIFVHGGPGFNSHDFEATTAEPLSKRGFFVVVYDQRGQGQSGGVSDADYMYKTYADDLQEIILTLKLGHPIIIGHSHGGPIAIRFNEYYPSLAKAIVLVSAPVNYWDVMKILYQNCLEKYKQAGSTQMLQNLTENYQKLATAKRAAPGLVDSVANLFQHALFGCNLYTTANPTPDEQKLRKDAYRKPSPMELRSMPGFFLNENYIYRDHSSEVENEKGRYFAIYGDEDGLFTPAARAAIENVVNDGKTKRFYLVRGASHALYLDQQQEFLSLVSRIAK